MKNSHLLNNTWQLIRPYWTSEEKWSAIWRLVLILVFSTGLVRMQVISNDLIKSLYDAIQKFEIHQIVHNVLLYVALIIGFAAVAAIQGYIFGSLTNRWRRWLTANFVKDWLHKKAYYRMAVTGNQVDNPDQRIADDIDSLTSVTLTLVTGFYTAIFQLITFSILLWQVGALNFRVGGQPWHLPGYLLWCVFAYAVLNTLVTMLIGRRLTELNYKQQQFNANFRFGLMRLREYGEQVALAHGERNEQSRLNETYQPIFFNFLKILSVARNLTFFTRSTDMLSGVIGVLFALPIFVQTHATIGSLMQMSSLVAYEYDALSFIISSYVTIALWRAVVYRLTEFIQKIELSQHKYTNVHMQHDEKIIFDEIDIHLPNGQLLQEKLCWQINAGEKILIMGASGSGKSTILRLIADVWPFGAGRLTIPKNEKIFLSQKSYLPPTTLSEAICFPSPTKNFNLQQIQFYLTELNLSQLCPLLNEVRNWHHELSLGEQQKIALIRALIHQPKWLFLDEATASLDEKSEQAVYGLLEKYLPNATIVSVGHRKSLLAHHDRIIEI